MNASGLFRQLHDALVPHGQILDPGNAGTIRVDRAFGYMKLVTAGVETRTLANPTVPGVVLGIGMDVDGGDCTLTVTDGYTASGQTTIVFSDAGDFVLLYSVEVGANLRWRALTAGGTNAALTTAAAALTDNTGGTANTTLVANSAGVVFAFPISLAQLSNADVVTNIVPGFAGTIIKTYFVVETPATTASKAATLNLEIGTTNVTGGEVALTSANCTPLGALVTGAAVTAANVFTGTDTLSVEASSVTAFVEGRGTLYVLVSTDAVDDNFADLIAASNTNRTRIGEIEVALQKAGILP